MKAIIATVGISNSGKSTWSQSVWENNPDDFVIVNRDKIRELLFGYTESTISEYYHRGDLRKREKQVTKYEDTLINEALESGKVPIVDATHLDVKYLERLKYWNVPIELEFFGIRFEEAVSRNDKRDRKVDIEILKKQYNKYQSLMVELHKNPIDFTPVTINYDSTKPPCYIFDLDGTLANMGDRSPYEWGKVGVDSVDSSIGALTRLIDFHRALSEEDNTRVIICTGRDERSLDETQKWLKIHEVPYQEIYTRPKGDMRPDWIVKEEMWRRIAEGNYIVGMFEDRLSVVRRARALGLKVLNVEYNNF